MAKTVEPYSPKVFERTYKDKECTMVWKYDLNKFQNGPISVDIKWSNEALKEMSNPNKKPDGKLGELHTAFEKLDKQKKKTKKPKPNDLTRFW